jgi:Na+-translocating ferredoxin:NAD+ oxidoreductase RnfD subunit
MHMKSVLNILSGMAMMIAIFVVPAYTTSSNATLESQVFALWLAIVALSFKR